MYRKENNKKIVLDTIFIVLFKFGKRSSNALDQISIISKRIKKVKEPYHLNRSPEQERERLVVVIIIK